MEPSTERISLTIAYLAATLLGFAMYPADCVAGSHHGLERESSSVFGDPNQYRLDLAENLQMTLDSVELSARVSAPFLAGGVPELSERVLTASVSFPYRRKRGLIGVDLSHPVVQEAIDAEGNRLALLPTRLDWRRYEVLGYTRDRSKPSARRVPPSAFVELRLDPHQSVPSSLSSVKWYVQALYTENVIKVDVPFKASDEWIEAETMPDLEVRINKAESISLVDSAGKLMYLHRYWTTVQSRTRSVLRGRDEELRCGDALPKYLVLGTCFLTEMGTLTPTSSNQSVGGDRHGGGAYCFGESKYFHRVNGIRHIIAVHPLEVKLPFELSDISVPSFQAAGN